MVPKIRYPAGPVTPHGAYYVLNDRIPTVKLRSYDDTIVFALMGGEAIPDRTMPERVEMKGLKGLVPPWQTIDQKGAGEDGVLFIDSLFDPIEVEIDAVCHGRNPAYCRKVTNHLIASLDQKRTSELSWFTHSMGRWWAPVRWFKTPASMETGGAHRRALISLRLRADSGFWQSYPDVSEFSYRYASTADDFETDDPDDLGSGWTVALSGAGSGGIHVAGGEVVSTLNNKDAVAQRNSYTSTSDNQVAQVIIGNISQQGYLASDAAVDIWLRMPTNGTGGGLTLPITLPGTLTPSASATGDDGVRLRISSHSLEVASFNSGVKTVLRTQPLIVPPIPGETWTFMAGTTDDPRIFKIQRSGGRSRFNILGRGTTMWSFKEAGTVSQLGPTFRAVGIGLHAGSSAGTASIRGFASGTNITETQSGFVRCINAGDQDMWRRYTLFGPFTKVKLWDGPNAGPDQFVEFGPLTKDQVVQIRTDPRKYGVKDLTSTPKTPGQTDSLSNGLTDFLSFISLNNITHGLDVLQSIFGIFGGGSAPVPDQGNLYQLMKGRFSQPIPPRPAGAPAQEYFIKVSMEGGNADSKILSAGTPLRRYPF